MQITIQQFDAMQEADDECFVARLGAFIRERCDRPEAFDRSLVPAEDHAFDRKLDALVAVAREHGFVRRLAIAKFAVLGFSYSTRFHEIPAVEAILRDPVMDDLDRVDLVFNRVILAAARAGRSRARHV